jgi:hypothetical protein
MRECEEGSGVPTQDLSLEVAAASGGGSGEVAVGLSDLAGVQGELSGQEMGLGGR